MADAAPIPQWKLLDAFDPRGAFFELPAGRPEPTKVGRYRLIEELGRGAMGRVYSARDPNTDRIVAVKLISGWTSASPEERRDLADGFLVEARALARLQHPAIVAVFDCDVDPELGLPYLVMEKLEGRPLSEVLAESLRLRIPTAVAIAAELARALSHAHGRGILHRDVKPANVVIGPDGRPKLFDFGLARPRDRAALPEVRIVGTPKYMSPEQARQEPLDARSDLFALGVLLYRCLAGVDPFEGETLDDVFARLLEHDPVPVERWNPAVPPALAAVVSKCLEKDRTRRFGSADEVAAALVASRRATGNVVVGVAAAPPSELRRFRSEPGRSVEEMRTDLARILFDSTASAGARHRPRAVSPGAETLGRPPSRPRSSARIGDAEAQGEAPRLEVIAGACRGQSVPIGTEPVIVGRSPCELTLADALVSRRHLSIERTAEGFLVKDLASANGTFLEGRRISVATMRPGQRLVIGEEILELRRY